MTLLRDSLFELGAPPPNPWDLSRSRRNDGTRRWIARPPLIPAAESALGLRPRSALSSAQVLPEWITVTRRAMIYQRTAITPLTSCLTPWVQFKNIVQAHIPPTQSGKRMFQGLGGVRQAAKARKQERFTALLHHLTVDLLRDSFFALKRQASPGVDGVTWQEYEAGLEDRLVDLHNRVHRGALSGAALKTSLYSEGRRAATSVGHRGTGGQNRSTGCGDDPQPDLWSTSEAFLMGSGLVAARIKRWTR